MHRALLIARSLLFYVGYVPVTIVMSTLFITLFSILPARGRYQFSAAWCKVILVWLRISCGVDYELRGKEHLRDGAMVVLANHQSSWETLFFYQLIYPIAPILKQELMRIPFWGWALRLLKPIAIDRSKPRNASRSLMEQGVQRLGEGFSVIIFPEGTRSPVGTVKPFTRSGAKLAIAAGVPVIPVALDAGKCWPPRQIVKYPGTIQIEIGPPIDSTGHNSNSLTAAAEDWIRQRLAA
jgi:1-acyl-sn-glycerol-3-phosphate acyltransferase